MFNIVEKRHWYFLLSALIIIPGLVVMIYSIATHGAPFKLSIDFTGGALQELRAERAVAALKRLAAPQAQVRRGGEVVSVPAAELVPGDLVLLQAGDLVPADLRLLECAELECDESTLTGEAQPVAKQAEALDQPELALGDRTNLAFGAEWRGAPVAAFVRVDKSPIQLRSLENPDHALHVLDLATRALAGVDQPPGALVDGAVSTQQRAPPRQGGPDRPRRGHCPPRCEAR